MKTLCLLALLIGSLCVTGCASIAEALGLNLDEIETAANESAARIQPLGDKLDKLTREVVALSEQAEIAREKGDVKAYADLLAKATAAAREVDLTKRDWDLARAAFEADAKRYSDAKSANGYVKAVAGSLGTILGMFGIGVPMLRRREEALRVTAANAEDAFGTGEGWAHFTERQAAALSPAARAVLRKLKPAT